MSSTPIAFAGCFETDPLITPTAFMAEVTLESGGLLSVKATGDLAAFLADSNIKRGQHLLALGQLREKTIETDGAEETTVWVDLTHTAINHFPDWLLMR